MVTPENASIKVNKDTFYFASHTNLAYLAGKRIFDVICSLLAIIILLMPMLLICLIIYIDDPHGSPLFTQIRVGRGEKEFRFYKFRSMYVDAEAHLEELLPRNEMVGPAFKIKNDPRITKVGRFIRKYCIDELPQLFNVLRGDMSIVGPRPPLPREVALYTSEQKVRLSVKPGLTCFWQISKNRNDITFNDWLELDLKYISTRSPKTDLIIILKTVQALLDASGE